MFDESAINPLEDGVTHINACSQGQSQLGNSIGNWQAMEHAFKCFADEPITFKCMEGVWYYAKLVLVGESLPESVINVLCNASGYAVKKLGSSLTKQVSDARWEKFPIDEFKLIIKNAIINKCMANLEFTKELILSTLPITHYYVYGKNDKFKAVFQQSAQWPFEWYSEIRDTLKADKPKTKAEVTAILKRLSEEINKVEDII